MDPARDDYAVMIVFDLAESEFSESLIKLLVEPMGCLVVPKVLWPCESCLLRRMVLPILRTFALPLCICMLERSVVGFMVALRESCFNR